MKRANSILAASVWVSVVCGIWASPSTNLAPTPPMGWNSWNWHGKQAINEETVLQTMDAMVANGMRDAGYVYVVVDGGWRDTQLGPNGELRAHPKKFPRGMKFLADYAHERGLKFGLHTVPGTHDCGRDPVGGYGHEEVHVRQFAEWGLDFIKLDMCRYEPGWNAEVLKAVYTKWSDLLAKCGRDIVYSISAYQFRDWYPGICHMARTTLDISCRIHGAAVFDETTSAEGLRAREAAPRDNAGAGSNRRLPNRFLSVMTIADITNESAEFAGRGYWNDAEMLVTGEQGLTQEEQKAHFALWCVMSSPLILGNDPRNLLPAEKEIVLNRECIAVNQDPAEQGRRIRRDGLVEVWVKRLSDNRVAVLLLNRDPKQAHAASVSGKHLGLPGAFTARDLFAKHDLALSGPVLSSKLEPHSALFLLVSAK